MKKESPQKLMVYLKGRTAKSVSRQQNRKRLYGILCQNCNVPMAITLNLLHSFFTYVYSFLSKV